MIIKSKDSGNAKFTRQELEVLEVFTEEEIKTILDYQEKLPILAENDNDTWINAEDLWSQLGVNKKFVDWFPKQVEIFELAENADFKPLPFKVKRVNTFGAMGGENKKYFQIRVECAKRIATVTGYMPRASKELKANSKLVMDYFLLTEKAATAYKDWLGVRNPEKYGYKVMDEALDRWTERNWHHKTTKYEYAVEADMLNEIVLGMKSKDKKRELGITRDDLLRDYLHKNYNEQLAYLQQMNTEFLNANYRWSERVAMLTRMYNAKYGNAQETNSIVA